jgi:hypothetical protein
MYVMEIKIFVIIKNNILLSIITYDDIIYLLFFYIRLLCMS